jgi:hypothetical protein
MNIKPLSALISASLLITACGGGSSSNSLTDNDKSYRLTGTVPGTLIEAYCDDGSILSVNSTRDGTNKHPFSIKLPIDIACRIVMITNENDNAKKVVTPIKFMDQQGVSSIAIRSKGKDIDLGHIALSLSRSAMTADGNNDGVEDIPKEIIVSSNDLLVVNLKKDPLDTNHDGVIDVYEDNDGDGIPNHDDKDDDNDGIPDINDNDRNNDGIPDNDLDGDGVKNGKDVDDDNDGIIDSKDTDDDNDGISDKNDSDDDNDGIDDKNDSDHSNKNENDDKNGSDDGKNGNDDKNDSNHDNNGNDDKNDSNNDNNGNDDKNGSDDGKNGNDDDNNEKEDKDY